MLAPPVDTRLVCWIAERIARSEFPAAHQLAFAGARTGSWVKLLPLRTIAVHATVLCLAIRGARGRFAATAAAAVPLTAVLAGPDADPRTTCFVVLARRDAGLAAPAADGCGALLALGLRLVAAACILRNTTLVTAPFFVAAALVSSNA